MIEPGKDNMQHVRLRSLTQPGRWAAFVLIISSLIRPNCLLAAEDIMMHIQNGGPAKYLILWEVRLIQKAASGTGNTFIIRAQDDERPQLGSIFLGEYQLSCADDNDKFVKIFIRNFDYLDDVLLKAGIRKKFSPSGTPFALARQMACGKQ